MGPFVMFLIGTALAAGAGMVYNAAVASLDPNPGPGHRPNPAVRVAVNTIATSTTPRPHVDTTQIPLTQLNISLSETFDRRSAELSRIVQHSTEANRKGRAAAIWRIDPQSATDNYNGDTQSAIHHFIPGDLLRNSFFEELNRPAHEWRYLVQMLRVAVENILTAPSNQLAVSNYELNIANWTLDLFDERIRSASVSTYDYDLIVQGLDTLYGVFYWSSFNVFIGPLPNHRQPKDQGNKLDVQLMPIMTLERSNRLRNLYGYFASNRNFDNDAVTDYISLTSLYTVPTSSGPWRPISNTLDGYFRELVRISRGQNQPPVSDAVEYLSENQGLVMGVKEQFKREVIDELKTCKKCKNDINAMKTHDCQYKKCPFFVEKMKTYYILDAWSVMRTWINVLLGKKEGVTPKFSLPDDVQKNYFDCNNDKDDGSSGCPSFINQNQVDGASQDIERFNRAFKKVNPDYEFIKMKHLPNRYLQPFGNALIMSSLTPAVVDCLMLMHNNPGFVVTPKRRFRRHRLNENDVDVKYNSQYLRVLVAAIHHYMNRSVDELSIFKQLVIGNISPNVQQGFNHICHHILH